MKKTTRFARISLLLSALSLLLILLPCLARADVSVTIKLERKEATLVDSMKLVVSVSGTRNTDSDPIINGLEGFNVTQGGTSSRVEIINGKVNAGVDYTYFIQPKKTGKFQIGPAEVTVEGKTFRSNTATATITNEPQNSEGDRGPLFLSAGLSSTKAYMEQQTIYTLKLYRQIKVSDISLDLPEAEHLVFKQLGKPAEYQTMYHGKRYEVLEIRYALIASREGTYAIGPTRMNMTVFQPRRRSYRGLFGDPFFNDPFFSFSTGRPTSLASESKELTVLPLPKAGRPAEFSGLVGTFKIESTLEPSTIRAGESATLTVLLSGQGNVNRIPDLKLPELAHMKVYADQPVLQTEPESGGLTGSKTMKWALVPEESGHHQIPPLSVSFFDTTTDQYRVIKTSSMPLSVLPGKVEELRAEAQQGNEHAPEGPAKQAVKELGHDILPVHTSVKVLAGNRGPWPDQVFFWLVLIAPAFVYLATFWGVKFRSKSDMSVAAAKAKKAAKKLTRRCRQGSRSASALALGIRDYLNDRFGLSLGSLTPNEGAEILESNGVSTDTAQELRVVLQTIEDAVYTGKGHRSSDIHEDIPNLVRQIEKEIG